MTFNGFGTQTAWPDGTGFGPFGGEGQISKGRISICDLSQGMNQCVGILTAPDKTISRDSINF